MHKKDTDTKFLLDLVRLIIYIIMCEVFVHVLKWSVRPKAWIR